MSVTGTDERLPRGSVVEKWRLSATAYVTVYEGSPDGYPETAYIQAIGNNAGSGGWILKSNYYD